MEGGAGRRVSVLVPNGSPFVPVYEVPRRLPIPVVGARVAVPFGSAILAGIVVGLDPPAPPPGVAERSLVALLDDSPFLPASLGPLLVRAAAHWFAAPGDLLRAAVPARYLDLGAARWAVDRSGPTVRAPGVTGDEEALLAALDAEGEADPRALAARLGLRRAAKTLRALLESGRVRIVPGSLRLAGAPDEPSWEAAPGPADGRLSRRPRQKRILASIAALGRPAFLADLASLHTTRAELRRLARDGLVSEHRVRSRADLARHVGTSPAPPPVVPTAAQAAAIFKIASAVREARATEFLLDGITGSGKTEVYLAALEAARSEGRQGILLVPEIALAPALVRRVLARFGDRVSLLHSALSQTDRAAEWERARTGEVDAVVGPRSAVFAPLPRLGLVVVDEAHDASYKQAESPRYDARDVARSRARAEGAVLVLGSATPAMEHEEAARAGRICRLSLPSRPAARQRAEVEVVDLRDETPRPGDHGRVLFARRTVEILSAAFDRDEQVILLLNRRGFSPSLLCRACGEDFRCARCSVARTYHRRGERLLCHWCGDGVPRPEQCPACGSVTLMPVGFGTERLEERFRELFPLVPYSVLDRDAAARRGGAAAVLTDFESGLTRALLGTQMVAKGHDFPNATALAVLDADAVLSFPDFRAAERTFQLVTQAAGRVGRGERPGLVAVQTARPDHEAIRCAVRQDHASFATAELGFRRLYRYPPFTRLLLALWADDDASAARAQAQEGFAALQAVAGKGTRLLGPAPAPIERIQGRWRFHLLVKAGTRGEIAAAGRVLAGLGHPPKIDVDPQNML